jgi:hypothetical protein
MQGHNLQPHQSYSKTSQKSKGCAMSALPVMNRRHTVIERQVLEYTKLGDTTAHTTIIQLVCQKPVAR